MVASRAMRTARELPSPLLAVLLLAAAAFFFGGGAGTATLPWLTGLAVVVAFALVAGRGTSRGLVVLVPLGAFAIWSACSVAWSIEPDRSWEYANRTALYAAFAFVGLVAAPSARRLAVGLGVVLGAVCVWSLAGKALPWVYGDYGRIARLRGPVGYWNSLALLGAIALPIGLHLASRSRAAGTLLVYGWVVAIGLTYSRGGVAVAALVALAWTLLAGRWLESVATLVTACLPAGAVLGVAFALVGITSDGQSHATRVRDGLVFGSVVLLGALVTVLLTRLPLPRDRPSLRRAVVGLSVVGAVAVLVVSALHARTWWDSFTAPTGAELSNTPGRFADTGSNHRSAWWSQAWRAWEAHPVVGTGAGSFRFTNLRYRTSYLDQASEPHSLPVQILSETGLVGAVLLLAGVGWLMLAGRRERGPELALALALPAYLLHGLIDMDWDYAAVTAPVFLIAGALVARPVQHRRASGSALLVSAGFGGVLLASTLCVSLAGRYTGQAEGSLITNDAKAVSLARRARTFDPLDLEPVLVQAIAEESRGRLDAARALYEKATEIQPESENAWFELGVFTFKTLNCPYRALPYFERAYQLNAQDPQLVIKDQVLALVNSGTPSC